MTPALLALALVCAAPAETPAVARRLALVVGVNDGGKGRAALHYAEADVAHGLVLGAPVRAGDTRQSHADVRAEARDRSVGQSTGDLG